MPSLSDRHSEAMPSLNDIIIEDQSCAQSRRSVHSPVCHALDTFYLRDSVRNSPARYPCAANPRSAVRTSRVRGRISVISDPIPDFRRVASPGQEPGPLPRCSRVLEPCSEKKGMIMGLRPDRSRKRIVPLRLGVNCCFFGANVLSGVISIALLLPQEPEGGWLQYAPRPTLRTGSAANLVLLGISRAAGYMMYICVFVVFTSKVHFVRSFLWATHVRLICPIAPKLHSLHTLAGWMCLWLTWVHSLFHVIRWAAQAESLHYLACHQTGLTGFIGLICVTFVCIPMGVNQLKSTIAYEIRKCVHVTCGFGFGVAGILHAPATEIMYIFGSIVLVYLADRIYASFALTYEVPTCHFIRLAESVVLNFTNPPGFKTATLGYVNVCVPFVSPYEWHAISLCPIAGSDQVSSSSLCIARVGDWTERIHDLTAWQTVRPCWIQGPFLTPFAASVNFDNAICVSSGSGVSASLAAIQTLKEHRRVSLIWLCRDASMVEFYLKNFEFDDDAFTLIYYSGTQKLSMDGPLPPHVLILEQRPSLKSIVCMIICSIESGQCLPESIVRESQIAEQNMQEFARELDEVEDETDALEMLRLMIAHSLRSSTQEELVASILRQPMSMDVQQFENLLFEIVPGARFTDETIEDLATSFQDVGGDGLVCRQRVLEHLQASVKSTSRSISKNKSLNVRIKIPDIPDDDIQTERDPIPEWCEQDLEFQTGVPRLSNVMCRTPTVSHETTLQKFVSTSADMAQTELIDLLGGLGDKVSVKARLERWCVMYCGRSKSISEELKRFCREFSLAYEEENFNW